MTPKVGTISQGIRPHSSYFFTLNLKSLKAWDKKIILWWIFHPISINEELTSDGTVIVRAILKCFLQFMPLIFINQERTSGVFQLAPDWKVTTVMGTFYEKNNDKYQKRPKVTLIFLHLRYNTYHMHMMYLFRIKISIVTRDQKMWTKYLSFEAKSAKI